MTSLAPPAPPAPPPRRTTTTTRNRDGYYSDTSPIPPSSPDSTTPTTPGLTQSTSIADSMQSTLSPITPASQPYHYYHPQARRPPRYPQEMVGRVPLHRRGTSRTYERLEDLLREAGYKETRIFTPEAERKRKKGKKGAEDEDGCAEEDDDDDDTTIVVEDKRASVMKEGVGAVMGFLAGLVNVGIPATRTATATGSPLHSTPRSPSPTSRGRRGAPHQFPHPEIVVHPTTPPPPPQSNQLHCQSLYHPNNRLQDQCESEDHRDQNASRITSEKGLGLGFGQCHDGASTTTSPITNTLASPRPSRATAYLRHISSAPNMMPPRPHSTPIHHAGPSMTANTRRKETERKLILNIDDTETDYDSEDIKTPPPTASSLPLPPPPLPPTWLETVARAVLFGGAGAHIGGPLGLPPSVVSFEGSTSTAAGFTSDTANYQVTSSMMVDARVESRPVQRQLRPSRSSISQASQQQQQAHHHHHRPAIKSPLSLYSTGTRSGLSDQTNLLKTTTTTTATRMCPHALPPALCSTVSKKQSRGEVEVSMTRVICRSAPGSRASSVVRGEEGGRGKRRKRVPLDLDCWTRMAAGLDREEDEENLRGRGRRVGRGRDKGKKRGNNKDKERVRVPSLARTRVEGDVWAKTKTRRQGIRAEVQVEGLDAGDGDDNIIVDHSASEEDDDEEDSDSDNSDSEPTLARMLLRPPLPPPPYDGLASPVARRQQSIKSLRKVLAKGGPCVASSGAGL